MGFDVGIGVGAILLGLVSQTFGWPAMWTVSALAILLGVRRRVEPARAQGAPVPAQG